MGVQRYLHHARDLANQLDLEATLSWVHDDLIDETSQDVQRLITASGIGEGRVQVGYFLSVDFSQIGVHARCRWLGVVQLCFEQRLT